MLETFETIVVGLGAMGSAATYHMASRGIRVLGLDQFRPPHQLGSSHGKSRIIREAYFEDPAYVPFVQRAYELWADLEDRSGEKLFLKTGGLMIGRPESIVFRGAKLSAETHGLEHEILTANEVHRRFPALRPQPEMQAVLEPRAGMLRPEDCIRVHIELARRHGAAIHLDESLLDWMPDGAGVRITTSKGTYRGGNIVFTAGSWLKKLVPDLKLPLKIERQVLFWFDTLKNSSQFSPDNCPIHLWESSHGEFFYGFPDSGDGVKVARHHAGESTAPESVRREISDQEVLSMRFLLSEFIPDANGPLRSATVCIYTNTPDSHFLIDRHQAYPQVLIASPCSGHGFKFSSAVGETLADLTQEKTPRCELSLFRLRW